MTILTNFLWLILDEKKLFSMRSMFMFNLTLFISVFLLLFFCFLLEMLNNKEKILFLKNIVNIRLKIFHLSCVGVNKIKFPVSVE